MGGNGSLTHEKEFQIIDAHHLMYRRMSKHINLLRMLLRQAEGGKLSLKDRWEMNDVLEEFPDLAELYDLPLPKRL